MERHFIQEKPELFKDDEFVDTTHDAPIEALARDILKRIQKLEETLANPPIGELIDKQRSLYQDLLSETLSLAQRLATIEEKLRRPTWLFILVLALLAVAAGAWWSSAS